MTIPEFVVELRSKIGKDPLPLVGVIGVIFDDDRRLLLARRSDNGKWSLVSGCVEPGEQPAAAMVREAAEETGVKVIVERLLRVQALDLSVCANGDQVYWTSLSFRCQALSTEAWVNDDESLEVGWFRLDALPPLSERERTCVAEALRDEPHTHFDR